MPFVRVNPEILNKILANKKNTKDTKPHGHGMVHFWNSKIV